MGWSLTKWLPVPRKPTTPETITAFAILVPVLYLLECQLYAKIKRRDRRSVGLQILSDASNDDHVKYEIVAVHGLGADPEHTWTCKSDSKSKAGDTPPRVHLLKDLLMKDERFSDARILHFAYNSDWLVKACFESSRDIGLHLVESLIEHRKTHPRLQLIFVGHSFGGIVIKEALSSDPKDTQRILEDTCGIIFLGTPHAGSPIAGFGATVAYLTGFLGSNTGLLLFLRSSGDRLRNLSDEFQKCVKDKYKNLGKKTKIISFYELKPTYLLNWLYAGVIVPKDSATLGANYTEVIKVDKDHSGLNKSRDSEDPLYKQLTEHLYRIRPNTPPKINALQQAVIDRLLPPIIVPDAEFHPWLDGYGTSNLECLPQTREEILKEICDWLDDCSSSQKHIYWLQGKAGTGKTTIARTVISRMAKKNPIVANFFFKRGEGDRARLRRFFITLAAQLARKLPNFAKSVQDALESDPSLPEQDPRAQFEKLIKEPIQQQELDKSKAIIVVVDALDECDSREDLATLVQLFDQPFLPDGSSAQLPIQYFLTGRLDHHTQRIFNETPEQKYKKVELEKATSGTVKRDIELYLRFHLEKIDGLLDPTSAEDPWSSSSNLDLLRKLTERVDPLFEFAAAACRFIAQTRIPGVPREFLHDILESETSGDLNKVYESIVSRRFYSLEGQHHKKAKAQFQNVIGSFISLADSVDVKCLAQLTDLPTQAIRQELNFLGSVLVVPAEQDNQSSVELFHESFRDFLTAPDTNEKLRVDSISAHKLLASRCRQLLSESLRENICNLKSPGTHRSEVADETVRECIPLQLQYACRFWVHHINRSGSNIKDGDEWHLFLLSPQFLNWIEALSLLGRISEGASLVTDLQMVSDGAQVQAFLVDAKRLILSFRHVIDAAPLQLYSSVLTFAPENSIVRGIFDKCRAKWISHIPDVDSQWGSCLQTIEHPAGATYVAFSPEGILASIGYDHRVKIWDLMTGICLHTLPRVDDLPSDSNSLAFSPGGKLAIRTLTSLVVWDIHQNVCLQNTDLAPHIDYRTMKSPSSVAFTDEHRLRLAGGNIWKIVTSELNHGCKARSNPFFYNNGMILSSNGQFVAYMFYKGILVFNIDYKDNNFAPTGLDETYNIDLGDWLACFSSDNRYFVSRQPDRTVKIWDISSGKCLETFHESESISALAFSHDSQLLGMGHTSGNIFIEDWRSCTRVRTFTRHLGGVIFMAFSPNDEWLASASRDHTVKIWDNSTHTLNEKGAACLETRKIKIAMDGQRLATTSFSGELQVWDNFGSSYIANPFEKAPSLVAISANGHIVVAVFNDRRVFDDDSIEVWDIESGDHYPLGNWYLSHIRSVALSENGERFVIGLQEGAVEVIESHTGRSLKKEKFGQKYWTASLEAASLETAISSDGELIAWVEVDKSAIHVENFGALLLPLEQSVIYYLRQKLPFNNFTPHSLAFSQNGKRFAAISENWDMVIWDVVTGACLTRFRDEYLYHSIWDPSMSFVIDFTVPAGSSNLEKWEDCLPKYYISPAGDWVMSNGKKLLWIPPEYQPKVAAVSGSNIAIERASGRLFVIGISDADL